MGRSRKPLCPSGYPGFESLSLRNLFPITSKLQNLKQYSEHFKPTIQLAIPVIIGQVGHVMMGVIDNAMVGRVGPVPLAAASIANGLFFAFMVIGIGISYAISPLTAIASGAQDEDGCSRIYKQSFYITAVSGIVLWLTVFSAADIITLLNQPEEVKNLAIPYLKILSFTMIPMMYFQQNRQFIEGLSVMRPAMIITIVANGVNAFANWVFIYGNLGVPAYGLDGAGYATFLSRTFMAITLAVFIYKAKIFRKFDLNPFPFRFEKAVSSKIFRLGAGSASQYFFEVTAFWFAAVMVGWLGAVPLASHQIAISVAAVTYMISVGISTAASIRVGNYIGRNDIHGAGVSGKSSLILTGAIMAFFALLLVLLNNFLPSLFIYDTAVQEKAAQLLLIAALFQIFDGTQAVGLGVLRGITDVRVPTIITFVAYWAIGLPAAYLFGFVVKWGVLGIWGGLSVALAVSALLLTLRFIVKTSVRHSAK